MENFKNDLKIAEFLLKIAKKSYKMAKKQKIEVNDKKAHDLVTNYDFFIEKFLIAELNKAFPDIKIVSEEFNAKEIADGTYFVIDPIDGTINFANGLNMWGVQIALVKKNETCASAIYMPFYGEFHAAKSFGAFKNGKKFVCEKRDLQHSLITIDNHDPKLFSELWKELAPYVMQQRFSGCACYNSVMIAQGVYGVYIVNPNAHPWDVLPGFLLSEEAGCVHGTILGQTVYATSKENLDKISEVLKNI